MGEIGKSLYNVLSKQYTIETWDNKENGTFVSGTFTMNTPVDILHICFPYSENFVQQVQEYQAKYNPKYTVIHSTVKPGTSDKLNAIHSPVIGIHPHLEESLTTFTKFLGGDKASEVADYFRRVGIKVYITENAFSTELMKILDTTYYAMCIEYTKEVNRLCDETITPFELWTIWNNEYNKGYQKLGYPEYTRPNLIPIMTKQGGHCTLPNCEFLDNEFTKFIKDLNES